MFSAIFYKEWIKTRRTVGLILLLLVALLVYALVQMGQTLRVNGAVQAWSAVLLKDMRGSGCVPFRALGLRKPVLKSSTAAKRTGSHRKHSFSS